MKTLTIPDEYSYIACFLTLGCQLKCSYCINIMEYKRSTLYREYPKMTPGMWIKALNRIEAREDLPITLQGGEPTSHPDFYEIINGVTRPMDLLTNAQFNIDEFIEKVPTTKFKRNAPYASIRVSYHPEQMELEDTVKRVLKLAANGYQVGVWMVAHPDSATHFTDAKNSFTSVGIDFRSKELLGTVTLNSGETKVYGTLRYPNSVGAPERLPCMCRTRELLVAPDGSIHRCHSDIYNLRKGIGHIMDEEFELDREFRFCAVYGDCSGCDVKIKTDRFQRPNYTAVEIVDIGTATSED